MVKDLINNNQNFERLEFECLSCNVKGHTLENCNRIHFVPHKELIIKKYNYNHPNLKRTQFKRKFISFNAKKIFRNVKYSQEKLIANNTQLIDDLDDGYDEEKNTFTDRDEFQSIVLSSREKEFKEKLFNEKRETAMNLNTIQKSLTKSFAITKDLDNKAPVSEDALNIDKVKSYKFFYPQFNVKNVLKIYAKKRSEARAKKRNKTKKI